MQNRSHYQYEDTAQFIRLGNVVSSTSLLRTGDPDLNPVVQISLFE
jgi:hypothetical protein